jgi:hypothetical protein
MAGFARGSTSCGGVVANASVAATIGCRPMGRGHFMLTVNGFEVDQGKLVPSLAIGESCPKKPLLAKRGDTRTRRGDNFAASEPFSSSPAIGYFLRRNPVSEDSTAI